jgi:hypothetical protein
MCVWSIPKQVVGTGDIQLSFGAFPGEVAGRVRFLHPLHNFSLVTYDPKELPDEVRACVRGETGGGALQFVLLLLLLLLLMLLLC